MVRLPDVTRVRIDEIRERILTHRMDLPEWEIKTSRHIGFDQYEPLDDWHPVKVGEVWGVPGVTVTFRKQITVPQEWAGERVALRMETGGEGLLSLDGAPYHGVDDNRTYILLHLKAKGGETHELLIEMKTGGYHEWHDETKENTPRPYLFRGASLLAVNRAVEEAYLDFQFARDTALAVHDPLLRDSILTALHQALLTVDFRDTSTDAWVAELTKARGRLKTALADLNFGDHPAKVFFTGHSHIDVAWLWPLRETARKTGRTFSTMTALLDEFPDFYFNCSQAPLFLYAKKYYPAVYEKIVKYVKAGRFEPVGGTWVEHDTNLISGESLVRQCLYGKRFFQKEFGLDVKVGWLPDVFGYTWIMPQIYKKAGIDYFMTSKISWNDTNKFPFSTFWWEGSDGTRLFTHFINGTYNADVTPRETLELWEAYPSKMDNPEFIASYGYGDGGGGPTREMIERVERMKDMPGLPKASSGRVHDFFERIEKESRDLPVWNGEFYFELHRGTYTSQARNKRGNRKCELLYRDAEFLSVVAMGEGRAYPQDALVDGWETILLNQFHDVIPGSSVTAVYEDSDRHYADIAARATTERDAALQTITASVNTQGEGTPMVVFNTLSWERSGWVSLEVPGAEAGCIVLDADGDAVPSSVTSGVVSFVAQGVPSMGYAVFHVVPGGSEAAGEAETPFSVEGRVVTTPSLRLEFEADGSLSRVTDLSMEREVLPAVSRANVLQFFEDKPANWEAWDVEPHYQDKVWEAEVAEPLTVLENTPDHMTLAVTLSYGKSTFRQTIRLYAHTARVDFIHDVEWREQRTLAKVAFPVDIRSSRATFDISYGAIERPTHQNTSWDQARFEVCGHQWADLSEADYGVSVLNDCKYGWDVLGNVIRLSLLRSPMSPDPVADQGAHKFTYSLYPHAGDWKTGSVREGRDLNTPLLPVVTAPHTGEWGARRSFAAVDRANALLDCVKKAEDGDDVILRVVETHGARGPVTVTLDRAPKQVTECDLLEEPTGDTVKRLASGEGFAFAITPFEVKTFRVTF